MAAESRCHTGPLPGWRPMSRALSWEKAPRGGGGGTRPGKEQQAEAVREAEDEEGRAGGEPLLGPLHPGSSTRGSGRGLSWQVVWRRERAGRVHSWK